MVCGPVLARINSGGLRLLTYINTRSSPHPHVDEGRHCPLRQALSDERSSCTIARPAVHP